MSHLSVQAASANAEIVPLDADHPGFSDPVYRQRRNEIAAVALAYRESDPVPHIAYTDTEHHVWKTVCKHLAPLHKRHACRAYREASQNLAFNQGQIPALEDINAVIKGTSGFRMVPVAGLVSSRSFLGSLARGVFLSTQYIRHSSVPLYTPEPDIIHELIGHAATFTHPDFTTLNRSFGQAALRVDEATLQQIERVYWYTLEFGAVHEEGELKAYGAGLLSSYGELGRFVSHPTHRPFDVNEIIRTPYDPTDYQQVLFVAPSFESMVHDVRDWLEGL